MRSLILSAALIWSAQAFAFEDLRIPADAPIAQAGKGTSPTDDDEDDPSPGAKGTPAATPDAKKPEEKKDAAAAPAAGAVTPTPAPANAQAQKLVSGAPLYNPNVAVHIVEQKPYSDKFAHEIVILPSVQFNGKFTQHLGIGAGYTFHLQENFGFQVYGYYNYWAEESAFNAELIAKVRSEAQAATSLLNTWGALAGVEVTPIYGKFAIFSNNLAHFSIVLNGGIGVGGTRHQLKPQNSAGPATYGDTGLRFLGGLGGGFRLQLGKRIAFRLEVRDVLYTARVDNVNGCTSGDLRALDNELRNGGNNAVNVSGGCNAESFGLDSGTNKFRRTGSVLDPRSLDVPLANNLVKPPISSDVLNNLGLYAGVGIIF